MANYIDNSLLAMQKSLRDVVLPAVTADDPLAREQLSLAIEYLGFLRQRLDFLAPRLRYELDHYSGLARRLIRIIGEREDTKALHAALERAALPEGGVAESMELMRAAVDDLSRTIDSTVETYCQTDSPLRPAVEKAVLDAANVWVDLELSWYAPLSVAASAAQPRPLGDFLGGIAVASR
jgi:hypothetical protein